MNNVYFVVLLLSVPLFSQEDSSESNGIDLGRITRRGIIHRNLAITTYTGYLLSDATGMATAALLHKNPASKAFDPIRMIHRAVGAMSMLLYIPQAAISWKMMSLKRQAGLKIDRKHRLFCVLTSIGVLIEIAGITTLAVLDRNNSPYYKQAATAHCAVSTICVVVPFTLNAVNYSRKKKK